MPRHYRYETDTGDVFELTEREAETFELLAKPITFEDIARTMTVTTQTARTYSKRLYGKLGTTGRVLLVLLHNHCKLYPNGDIDRV